MVMCFSRGSPCGKVMILSAVVSGSPGKDQIIRPIRSQNMCKYLTITISTVEYCDPHAQDSPPEAGPSSLAIKDHK